MLMVKPSYIRYNTPREPDMPDNQPHLSPEQEETLAALDSLQDPSGPENRCPGRVMAEGKAHWARAISPACACASW